jgi:uncharacterized membrane-anchored protein
LGAADWSNIAVIATLNIRASCQSFGEVARMPSLRERILEQDVDAEAVAAFYRHTPVDAALAARLSPDADFDDLVAELEEIGYPLARARD